MIVKAISRLIGNGAIAGSPLVSRDIISILIIRSIGFRDQPPGFRDQADSWLSHPACTGALS
jgi:hypothetical protein